MLGRACATNALGHVDAGLRRRYSRPGGAKIFFARSGVLMEHTAVYILDLSDGVTSAGRIAAGLKANFSGWWRQQRYE